MDNKKAWHAPKLTVVKLQVTASGSGQGEDGEDGTHDG